MKKTFKTILTLCCLVLIVVACSKDDDPTPGDNGVLTLSLKNITIKDFGSGGGEAPLPGSRSGEIDANGCVGLAKKQFVAGDVLRIEYNLFDNEIDEDIDEESHELYAKCNGADQWSLYTDAACTKPIKVEFDPENIPVNFYAEYQPADDVQTGIYGDWLYGASFDLDEDKSTVVIGTDGTIIPQIIFSHQRALLSVASAKKNGETDLDITALSVCIGDNDTTEPEHTSTFVKTGAGWQAITPIYNNSSYNYTQSFSLTVADGKTYTISNVNKKLNEGYHYALHLALDGGELSIKIEETTEIPAWTDGGTSVFSGDYDRVIATYADLVALRDEINSANTVEETVLNVIQAANIVMPPDAEAWTVGIGNQSPINNNNNILRNFRGVYNGNGYTISGLRVKVTDDINTGLFGSLENATLVKIHLREVNVENSSRGYSSGSLAGSAVNSTISRCTATGIVSGATRGFTGGLVGYSQHTHYTRNHSACTVNGSFATGGLVGYSLDDKIISCVATGNTTAHDLWSSAGGLVGNLSGEGDIWYSYATGWVVATNKAGDGPKAHAGGLIGSHDQGSVGHSYSTGKATATGLGNVYAGTFVGYSSPSAYGYTHCWTPKPDAGEQVLGYDPQGISNYISADGTQKPGDVVRSADTINARTLVADDDDLGEGPAGARIRKMDFVSSKVWTADDYPEIVFDPF